MIANTTKRNLIAALYAVAAGGGLMAALPAMGTDHIARPFDWTIELKTKQLPHHFEYTNSHLHGVEKIHVSYVHASDSSHPDPQPTEYENLWYHSGKPLGLERLHKFEVIQGDSTSILVSHSGSSASDDECKAAANAVLRLILDANLNKNAVVNIRVPDDSFERIKQDLYNLGCQDGSGISDEGRATAINLFLQTDPDPHSTQILYYI